jgi:hypothetical protein
VFPCQSLLSRRCFSADEFGSLALELRCLPFDFCVATLEVRAHFVALFLPVGGRFVMSGGRGVVRPCRPTMALC